LFKKSHTLGLFVSNKEMGCGSILWLTIYNCLRYVNKASLQYLSQALYFQRKPILVLT